MADGKTDFWILGAIITALTGLYYFFVRHVFGHVNVEEIRDLKNDVQYKRECSQIVKRIDENHDHVCRKLDRILDKLNGE
jgi:hypothetical protein